MDVCDAARYLVYLSYNNNNYYSLTPLKLQKILYYAQGWSYVWDGRPLFDDEFEAWQYGPVSHRVYNEFKSYKYHEIKESEGSIPSSAEDYELETLEAVWKEYGKKSASELVESTHNEDPWNDAISLGQKISNNSIKKYFLENY